MNNLNELAAQLHAAAVEKGFWDIEDADIKHIAKMHCELSEAVQADRAGIMYTPEDSISGKPEGVAVELADFVMMALDLCARMEIDIDGIIAPKMEGFQAAAMEDYKKAGLCTLVLECHAALTKATLADSETDIFVGMSIMIYGVEMWLEARGYDLRALIEEKRKANINRPKLHGRLY